MFFYRHERLREDRSYWSKLSVAMRQSNEVEGGYGVALGECGGCGWGEGGEEQDGGGCAS
jgi:hypothetical protein